ncbi:MAG: HNH endonuclease, partial [Limnospira sp. Paracas R14]|nr:HNH endonuclease [Limnospira sp. Paracas R14]
MKVSSTVLNGRGWREVTPFSTPSKERHESWLFQTKDGLTLWQHKWTPIVRHTIIRPDATPYDGNWTYWATRKGQAIDTP